MHPIVLVIEDDNSTRSFLENILTDQGYIVKSTPKGTSGLQILNEITPDLVLLDLELPDINGESVCAQIKKQFASLPVIMLTAKNSLNAKIQGFDLGADDYVTKPFETEELLVRIKARLRQKNISNSILKIGDLELDSEKIEVKRAGKTINLTPREFELLQYLMQNSRKVISRDMILNKIWAYSFEVESRVVDVYMGYLRKKIDRDHKDKLIKSVRGFGYTIKE
ncbi:response regulator transcription factor [Patescibacteria group bacterium]|nr:response regulator transcription factor [Patescibacteria group bacterium]